LPYCPGCGTAYTEGAAFCSTCGRSLQAGSPGAPATFAQPAVGQGPPAQGQGPVQRPTGVTILAALQIAGSVVDIALGLFLGIFGFVVVVFGVLTLFFAVALLSGRNWARILILVGAVLDIISIVGIIWGAILLYYFTRPHVVAYFKAPK
jgi:hypothetical protein